MNFDNVLAEIKRSERLSLKEIASLSGIPYSTMKQYSGGRRSPSRGNLQKIAAVPRLAKYRHLLLGTDPDDIPESELDGEISRLWQALKDQGREAEALSILNYVLNKPEDT